MNYYMDLSDGKNLVIAGRLKDVFNMLRHPIYWINDCQFSIDPRGTAENVLMAVRVEYRGRILHVATDDSSWGNFLSRIEKKTQNIDSLIEKENEKVMKEVK